MRRIRVARVPIQFVVIFTLLLVCLWTSLLQVNDLTHVKRTMISKFSDSAPPTTPPPTTPLSTTPLSKTPAQTITASPPNPHANVLLWTAFWGSKSWGHWDDSPSQLKKELTCIRYGLPPVTCTMYKRTENSNPLDYDALMFHFRDDHSRESAPKVRKQDQVYILYSAESPHSVMMYARNAFVHGHFYNWTWTPMDTSDVHLQYGFWFDKRLIGNTSYSVPDPATTNKQVDDGTDLEPWSVERERIKNLLPFFYKDGKPIEPQSSTHSSAAILWVVSNCDAPRMNLVKKIKAQIPVDIFGKCTSPCPVPQGQDCKRELAKLGRYKFYLAIENSACLQYITEKPYEALDNYMIPIVLGGLSADDYTHRFPPPTSYVDIRNFATAKELADHINSIVNDEDVFLKYHRWRLKYSLGRGGVDMCGPCIQIATRDRQQSKSVDFMEFYNPERTCDVRIHDKALKGRTYTKKS